MDLSLNLKGMISLRLIPKQDSKGRAAVVEVMLNTPLISDLIFKGDVSEIKEIMKKSRNLGMQTFDQALFDLCQKGLITREEAARRCTNPDEFRMMLSPVLPSEKRKRILEERSCLRKTRRSTINRNRLIHRFTGPWVVE